MTDPAADYRRRLEPLPTAPAEGRALVERALRRWNLPQLVEDAALVTSELVANAVMHTHQPFDLRVSRSASGVRIEVSDRSSRRAVPRRTDPLEPGGLGLVLVASVARAWGSDESGTGKTVWAELDA